MIICPVTPSTGQWFCTHPQHDWRMWAIRETKIDGEHGFGFQHFSDFVLTAMCWREKKVRIWVHKYFQGSYLKDLQELKESKGQESTENYRKSPSQKRRETQAESITDFTSQIHRSCWGRTQRWHRSPYYSAFPLIKRFLFLPKHWVKAEDTPDLVSVLLPPSCCNAYEETCQAGSSGLFQLKT